MSRKYVVGIGLAAALMFAGGTGMAVAASPSASPTTTAASAPSKAAPPATSDPASARDAIAICKKTAVQSKTGAAAITKACLAKLGASGQVRALPLGAPQTGGGGMASVVSTWH